MELSPPIERYISTWKGLCSIFDGFRLEKQDENCTALYRKDFFCITRIGPVIKLLPLDIIYIVCGISQSLQVNHEKIQQISPRLSNLLFTVLRNIIQPDVIEEELRRKNMY
jgi:hypothetical protein